MKHVCAALFSSVMMLSQPALAQLSVFACEPEWAALVTELGGDRVSVVSATTARQDPHHIQARPGLIAKIRDAELLVCTGAELELGWLPLLLQKSGNAAIQPGGKGWFMAADHVELLDKPRVIDRREGDVHLAGNPHFHTSPDHVLQVAAALTKTLQALDAAGEEHYANRHQRLLTEFDHAKLRWQEKITLLRGKKIVSHHTYWVYLERWLGLQRIATLEAKPGVAPSSAYLAGLVDQVKREAPSWILYESYQSRKAADWLSQQTGVPVRVLPATVENWQEPGALLQWYEQLIHALVQP